MGSCLFIIWHYFPKKLTSEGLWRRKDFGILGMLPYAVLKRQNFTTELSFLPDLPRHGIFHTTTLPTHTSVPKLACAYHHLPCLFPPFLHHCLPMPCLPAMPTTPTMLLICADIETHHTPAGFLFLTCLLPPPTFMCFLCLLTDRSVAFGTGRPNLLAGGRLALWCLPYAFVPRARSQHRYWTFAHTL